MIRLIILSFLLAGCTTVSQKPIPHELLEDCLVGSKLGLATNQELSDTVAKLAHTLKLCNIDKRKLREWAGAKP